MFLSSGLASGFSGVALRWLFCGLYGRRLRVVCLVSRQHGGRNTRNAGKIKVF